MNPTGLPGEARTSDDNAVTDAPLMAATPVWETRGKKRRGPGRNSDAAPTTQVATQVAAEPRSFSRSDEPVVDARLTETRPMTERGAEFGTDTRAASLHEPSLASTAAVTDPVTGRPDLVDEQGFVAPIARTRPAAARRTGGAPIAAIAAGVVALGAVGAAGWYATRGDDGVAELTPGADSLAVGQAPVTPAAPMMGAAPVPPVPPMEMAQAPAAPAARAEQPTAPVRSASRARPAAAAAPAASATEQGIDASGTATLPAGPQPYSAPSPGAAASPEASTVAPAPIPSTPPIVAIPAPSVAEPAAAPADVTPPPQ